MTFLLQKKRLQLFENYAIIFAVGVATYYANVGGWKLKNLILFLGIRFFYAYCTKRFTDLTI